MNPAGRWSALRSSIRRAAQTTVAVGTFCAVTVVANAASIIYTMSGVGDGSLGPTRFAGATLVVAVAADTSAVRALAPGVPCCRCRVCDVHDR